MNPNDRERRLRFLQELEKQQRRCFLMTPQEQNAHDKQQITKSLAWHEYLARVRGPGKPQRGDDVYPPWSLSDDPSLASLPGEEFPRS
jgi:hypothetical protein